MTVTESSRVTIGEDEAVWDYLLTYELADEPEGVVPLGGDVTIPVGWQRFQGQFRLARSLTRDEARQEGLLKAHQVGSVDHDPTTVSEPSWARSPGEVAHLHYSLTTTATGLVLAVNIDDFVRSEGIAGKALTRGAFKLGYPLPTFKACLVAAHAAPETSVVAMNVPFSLVEDHEAGDDPLFWRADIDYWHLSVRLDTPDGWQGSAADLEQLLSDVEFADALHRLDLAAWAVARESTYWFYGAGKAMRFVKGAFLVTAGVALAVFGVSEVLDGLDGADAVAGAGLAVDPGQAFEASSVAGASYAGDVQFGASTDVYDPNGADKVSTYQMDGTGTYGTNAHGDKISVNQWGSVKKL